MDWSRLKYREKAIFVGLAAFLVFGIYSKAIREPMSRAITASKTQIKKARAQLSDLKTKEPQDEQLKAKTAALEAEAKKMDEQINTLEMSIPSRFSLDKLVGEFTRLANEVRLESIKQRVVKDQEYSRVFLEVRFFSGYASAIRYLSSVESISPFLKLEEMEILEPPKGKILELGGSPVRLLMSCLLSDHPGGVALKASTPATPVMKRDILSSAAKPQTELEESKYKLQGISFNAKNPTAIINDDVYAIGADLDGFKVKKISPNSVTLSDGSQEHVLNVQTQTTEKKSETH